MLALFASQRKLNEVAVFFENREIVMTSRIRTISLLLVAVTLAACSGPNPLQDAAVPISEVSGFWGGIWHGLILPVSFLGSLLTDYITIYAVQNTGGWYDFGFMIGVSILAAIMYSRTD